MNRRKTIPRRFSLLRLLGRAGNRRVRVRGDRTGTRKNANKAEKKAESAAVVSKATVEPAPRGQRLRETLNRAATRALQLMLFATKVALVGLTLLGAAFGGYYAYNRAVTSDYFDVRLIEVKSTRRAATDEVRRLVEGARDRNLLTLDLDALRRAALAHPWVSEVSFERRLPNTLRVIVTEHKARALLLMGHLYLVNEAGQVFKRADQDEREGMPVITGISRMSYLESPGRAKEQIARALEALDRYYSRVRPPLSEVHLEAGGEMTLYLRRGGVAVRVGAELTDQRMAKMDAVWAALGPEARRARVLFLDNVARKDRVTVRMGGY
jgi:cell division protein FtsQ